MEEDERRERDRHLLGEKRREEKEQRCPECPPATTLDMPEEGEEGGEHEAGADNVSTRRYPGHRLGLHRVEGEEEPGGKGTPEAREKASGREEDEGRREAVEHDVGGVEAGRARPPETVVDGQGEGEKGTVVGGFLSHRPHPRRTEGRPEDVRAPDEGALLEKRDIVIDEPHPHRAAVHEERDEHDDRKAEEHPATRPCPGDGRLVSPGGHRPLSAGNGACR